MEEEDAKNIDDVLTALLSMGFELEDSQAAVQSGRLTVESAVEWLLTQKSRPANTCRLYEIDPVVSSSPFVSSDPSPPTSGNQDEESGSQTPTDKPEENEEESIISRRFVNSKQREIKEKFEEKQRSEAQRLAILERKQQKSARALVLQQIADDREQQKQYRTNTSALGTGATAQPVASPTASSPLAATSAEDGDQSSPTSPAMCNMQIRHPDGQSLRHTFDGSTLLQDIWSYATENFTDTENMCLMQPFPRRDFTKEDASKSLLELGLCPSVGLVLKKTDGSQQAFGRN